LSNFKATQAFKQRSSVDKCVRLSLFAISSNESGPETKWSNNLNSTAVNKTFEQRYPSIRDIIWFKSAPSF